jgi:toxin-antitoxin system PIN domain toxin
VSFSIDVNVLLYSSDESSSVHQEAVAFLCQCIEDTELMCIAWITVMSYLRMATHPGIFSRPLSPDAAMRNVEALVRLPHVRMLGEQEGFLLMYRDVMNEVPVRGNLVPDAHLAVILKQHGVKTLWSRDRDFLKFPFLKLKDPFATG